MTTYELGASLRLHHIVDPGFELVVPVDAAAATTISNNADVLVPWAATDENEARLTTAAICVETKNARIVIDPFSAFANGDRSSQAATDEASARVQVLTEAGFGPGEVDAVLLTHFDGSGALTVPDGEVEHPVYDVKHLMTAGALHEARTSEPAGAEAVRALDAADLFEVVEPGPVLDGAMTLVSLEAHGTGHVGVHIEGDTDSALVTGHLFLHPATIYDLTSSIGDQFPDRLEDDRTAALELTGRGLLVGDLFCAPGAVRVRRSGDGWSLTPAVV